MKLTGMAVGVLAAAGFLMLPAESQAGVRVGIGIFAGDPHSYVGYRDARDTFRYGYDRGFEEGQKRGARDGEHNRRFEFWRDGAYRDTDRGYKGWMGPRFEYANGYRQGYEAGYRRAYERFERVYDRDWRDHARERWDRDDWRDDRRRDW